MKTLIIGTAGHIDHGKTALIKALTKIDCDTHKEEKRRGITINLGFSHLDFEDGNTYGIIDVPGHKDFINTMITGASGMDMVLLIVAADSGIMPQTIEHLNIVSTLGITKLIVVLTKTDLVDEDLVELATMEILELLENYNYENAAVIPVSAHKNIGLDLLKDTINETAANLPEKSKTGGFRMYIDRIFSVTGKGTVVTGSVLAGKILVGDELFLYPGEKEMKVKGIQKHGLSVEEAEAGTRTAINLSGFKPDEFEKGMILCEKKSVSSVLLDACMSVFAGAPEMKLWSTVMFQSGSFECLAKIHLLDKDKLGENQNAIIQIHLSKPAWLLAGDKFILRNSSADKTTGGGTIIDIFPLHHRKRTAKLIQELEVLSDSILKRGNSAKLVAITLNREAVPLSVQQVSTITGIPLEEMPEPQIGLFEVLGDEGNPLLISSTILGELKSSLTKILENHHIQNNIFEAGLTIAELSGKDKRFTGKSGTQFLYLVLQKMKDDSLIDNFGQTWRLFGHSANLSDSQKKHIKWLEDEILNYELQKPVYAEIEEKARDMSISKDMLKNYLKYLQTKDRIFWHDNEFVHLDILNKCSEIIVNHLKTKVVIDIREFREILQATKKICPVLMNMMEKQGHLSVKPVEFNFEISLK